MDSRAATAFPSSRKNTRFVTDVTFHPSLFNAEKKSYSRGFSYGNAVPRPLTTIGTVQVEYSDVFFSLVVVSVL